MQIWQLRTKTWKLKRISKLCYVHTVTHGDIIIVHYKIVLIIFFNSIHPNATYEKLLLMFENTHVLSMLYKHACQW